MTAPANKKVKMLTISLKDRTQLFSSYMSFLNNGGIFVKTNDIFTIGEEVLLVLEVMQHPNKFPLQVKVAWVNNTVNQYAIGVGLAFPNDEIGNQAKAEIEKNLAGLLDNSHPTFTL